MTGVNKLIGVIDAGTNSVKFVIYNTPNFEEICSHEIQITQISEQANQLEQDPVEILNAIRECASIVIHLLPNFGLNKQNIACVGVTNQRETVVCWNKVTGEPLYNAIGKQTF